MTLLKMNSKNVCQTVLIKTESVYLDCVTHSSPLSSTKCVVRNRGTYSGEMNYDWLM